MNDQVNGLEEQIRNTEARMKTLTVGSEEWLTANKGYVALKELQQKAEKQQLDSDREERKLAMEYETRNVELEQNQAKAKRDKVVAWLTGIGTIGGLIIGAIKTVLGYKYSKDVAKYEHMDEIISSKSLGEAHKNNINNLFK